MAHLANWDTTLYLFATDYRLPFLPSVPAAYFDDRDRVVRAGSAGHWPVDTPDGTVLLGMTTVIEVFIYPLAWPPTPNGRPGF